MIAYSSNRQYKFFLKLQNKVSSPVTTRQDVLWQYSIKKRTIGFFNSKFPALLIPTEHSISQSSMRSCDDYFRHVTDWSLNYSVPAVDRGKRVVPMH